MDNINQVRDKKSRADGWVKPTWPWTPPNPCIALINKMDRIITPTALVTSPATGLIVYVTGEVGIRPKKDNKDYVKLTIVTTDENNIKHVKTYLLYKGATLLVQQYGKRLAYVTVE